MIRGGSRPVLIPEPRRPAVIPPAAPVPVIPPQRSAPASPGRPVAEIIAAALAAPCFRCLTGAHRPCTDEGIMHLARLCRAETLGLITGAEYAEVALSEGVSFTAGIVFLGETVTAQQTPRERWLAGLPARDKGERQRYAEYALREEAGARHAAEARRSTPAAPHAGVTP